MTDEYIRRAVSAMVFEAATKPKPSAEDTSKLKMMAVLSTHIVHQAGPIIGADAINNANFAIFRAAYELGKLHGGMTWTVAPEEVTE